MACKEWLSEKNKYGLLLHQKISSPPPEPWTLRQKGRLCKASWVCSCEWVGDIRGKLEMGNQNSRKGISP